MSEEHKGGRGEDDVDIFDQPEPHHGGDEHKADLNDCALPAPSGQRVITDITMVDYVVPEGPPKHHVQMAITIGTIDTDTARMAELEQNAVHVLEELRSQWEGRQDVTLKINYGVVETLPPVQECFLTFVGGVDQGCIDELKARLTEPDYDTRVFETWVSNHRPYVDVKNYIDGSVDRHVGAVLVRYRIVHSPAFVEAVAAGQVEMKPQYQYPGLRGMGDVVGCAEDGVPATLSLRDGEDWMVLPPRSAHERSLLADLYPLVGLPWTLVQVKVEPAVGISLVDSDSAPTLELVHWFLPNDIRLKLANGIHHITVNNTVYRTHEGAIGRVYV